MSRLTLILAVLLVAGPAGRAAAQGLPPIRPERTAYRETSRYEEVAAYLEAAAAAAPDRIRLATFGYSMEGRPLPLAVVGAPGADPAAVRAAGKTRVFIQANIHGGEVEGKEAMLVLLRDLAAGQHAAWLDSLVLLVAPIYNADGNERIGLLNRSHQHGPVGGMGERANAQGLDLNRDHMKVDSPEARSLLGLFQAYDPHVVLDLHTTNGTFHAYHLTYSPPLHPNTHPGIVRLLREEWLPSVTRTLRERHGWETYYYGNLPWPGQTLERGWYTFDHRPRFNNSYVGLRNRFAILSEAYAYLPFRERIEVTLRFVESALDFARAHASRIRRITQEADRAPLAGQPLALSAGFERSAEPVEILLGEVAEERNPYTGAPMYRRLEVRRPERMYAYGVFRPAETARAPEAYYVPPGLPAAEDRLAAHGIRYERLASPQTLRVERFVLDSLSTAPQPFQGRRARTAWGRYEERTVTLPAGTLRVPVAQPLGRLAFYLLEPRSDDGLLHWGLLDEALEGAGAYPIVRR